MTKPHTQVPIRAISRTLARSRTLSDIELDLVAGGDDAIGIGAETITYTYTQHGDRIISDDPDG